MRRLAVLSLALSLALALSLPALAPAKKRKTQPVTITLLPGSTSTLDLGGGNVREIALTGGLKGTADAKIDITKTIPIKLTKASIVPAPITVFDDPSCPATPALATDSHSLVTLDRKHRSTSTLNPSTGKVTGSAATRLRIALSLRSAGCGGPLVPSGYADTFQRFTVKGKIDPKTGLQALVLDSAVKPIAIAGCTSVGDPAKKCTTKPLVYRGKISVHLVVKVELGGPPAPTSP
jgi:hypothetical protein